MANGERLIVARNITMATIQGISRYSRDDLRFPEGRLARLKPINRENLGDLGAQPGTHQLSKAVQPGHDAEFRMNRKNDRPDDEEVREDKKNRDRKADENPNRPEEDRKHPDERSRKDRKQSD